MSSVLIPDFAGPLIGNHTGADRRVRRALLAEERTLRGRCYAGHDVSADTALGEDRRGKIPEPAHIDREALPGIDLGELVAQPEIPVGHMGDAAPVPADGTKHLPELCLGVAIARGGHAARIHVDHSGRSIADQLDQLDQAGENVERLEARDAPRNAMVLYDAPG